MIDLERSYIATEHEKNVWFYLEFKCEHCDQAFNEFSFNISVFLYGASFIVGQKHGYAGITCPTCLNTILLKGNSLVRLQQDLNKFFGPNDSHLFPDPRYHSSVLFSPSQIEHLNTCDIQTWTCPISDFAKENFDGMLGSYIESEPRLSQEYLCSYIYGNAVPIGSFASIWWFRPDEIKKLVHIENEHQFRVFPRYVHKMAWYDRFDYFCWRYRIYQDYLKSLKKSADENYDLLREYAYQENINLDRLYDSNPDITKEETIDFFEQHAQTVANNDIQAASEFLDLLVNFNPQPWDIQGAMSDHFNGLWKSISPFRGKNVPSHVGELIQDEFKPRISDQEISGLCNQIRPFITKSHVQDWAVEHHQTFIKDYISLACRSDFSYGNVWDLKCTYLKALSEIKSNPHTVSNAENAFYVGKDTTTITFNGTISPGLIGKGYKYIQYLMVHEKEHIDNLELLNLFPVNQGFDDPVESGSEEKTDKKTLEWLRSEILTLKEEREEAEGKDDLAKIDQVNGRLEQLEDEWKRISRTSVESRKVTKSKKFSSNEFRQRDNVKQAILRAIKKLKKIDRKTWEHFDSSLKPVGLDSNRYLPNENIDWDIK